MKISMCSSLVLALALAGCASSGGSGAAGDSGSGTPTTMFSNPKEFSKDEFAKDSKGYAKNWVDYKGGGADSFKKITIPAYTIEFQKNIYKVDKSKMAAMFLKADGAKSELTMNVGLPVNSREQLLKDITATSYNRMKEKFKKAGVELVEWSEVKSQYPDAVAFEKDKLSLAPVVTTDSRVSFTSPGGARLNSAFWAFAASSLSRDSKISFIMPNFAVGYGYFGGEPTAQTITEKHDFAEIQFTPQVQVLAGSGFSYHSKWDSGVMVLKNTLVSNESFVKKLNKVNDSRQVAKEKGETARQSYASLTGAKDHEVQVSTTAAINYELGLDDEKFKTLVLAELDKAEDLVVERYKNTF